jgi:cysteine desulfurase
LTGDFANPSSTHARGLQAAQRIEIARQQVADALGTQPGNFIWTSGATESNNLAIQGIAQTAEPQRKHLITSRIEHKSVFDVFKALEKQGFEVTYLTPNAQGVVELSALESVLRPQETLLVSLMYVNNETGVIQPITEIGHYIKQQSTALFHVDAVQAVGRLPIHLESTPIDLLSFSAHKFYGPKGIGVLYCRNRPPVRLAPLFYGGGQQKGLRPGTLPTHQIAACGLACALSVQNMNTNNVHLQQLEDLFLSTLTQTQIVFQHNGAHTPKVPGIINLSFPEWALNDAPTQILASLGSACNATLLEPSPTLRAMGLSDRLILRTIRFSFGQPTQRSDILWLVEQLKGK